MCHTYSSKLKQVTITSTTEATDIELPRDLFLNTVQVNNMHHSVTFFQHQSLFITLLWVLCKYEYHDPLCNVTPNIHRPCHNSLWTRCHHTAQGATGLRNPIFGVLFDNLFTSRVLRLPRLAGFNRLRRGFMGSSGLGPLLHELLLIPSTYYIPAVGNHPTVGMKTFKYTHFLHETLPLYCTGCRFRGADIFGFKRTISGDKTEEERWIALVHGKWQWFTSQLHRVPGRLSSVGT